MSLEEVDEVQCLKDAGYNSEEIEYFLKIELVKNLQKNK